MRKHQYINPLCCIFWSLWGRNGRWFQFRWGSNGCATCAATCPTSSSSGIMMGLICTFTLCVVWDPSSGYRTFQLQEWISTKAGRRLLSLDHCSLFKSSRCKVTEAGIHQERNRSSHVNVSHEKQISLLHLLHSFFVVLPKPLKVNFSLNACSFILCVLDSGPEVWLPRELNTYSCSWCQ